MNRFPATFLFGLFVSASICLAQAQPANPPGESPRRPAGLAGPGGPRPFFGNIRGLVDKMKTDLALDASQQTSVQTLVDEFDKNQQTARSEVRLTAEEAKQMSELRDKMKKANDTNDQASVKETSEQMQQLRKSQNDRMAPARERMTKAQDELKDKLRGVLREDQKAAFDKLWDEQMNPASRMRSNPRLVRSLIDALPDASSDQKRQIVDLMKQYDEAMRTQKDLTPAQRDEQSKRTCDSMLNLLTPEQREKVQSRMDGRRGALRRAEGPPPERQKPEEKP